MTATARKQVQAYSDTAAQSVRDQLIVEHLWLVRHLIGKLAAKLPPGVDVENLESAGVLGLVEAARRFDAARGVEFKAFASMRIHGAIIDEARRNSPLPQELLQHVTLVSKAQEKLVPPITVEALAAATGLSEDDVLDALNAMPLTQVKSFDPSTDEFSSRIHTAPTSDLERAEDSRLLADAIESLGDRERLIVTLYYREDLRLKEIGQVMGLSESRVSRLLKAAEIQLRDYVADH